MIFIENYAVSLLEKKVYHQSPSVRIVILKYAAQATHSYALCENLPYLEGKAHEAFY
jgi:hypothetical protein